MSEKIRESIESFNVVNKEIQDGVFEYVQEKQEESDSQYYINQEKISESESILAYIEGVEKVYGIVQNLTNELIGAQYSYQGRDGYIVGQTALISEYSNDQIIDKLASENEWMPLYDDSLVFCGEDRGCGDWADVAYSLGGRYVCFESRGYAGGELIEKYSIFDKLARLEEVKDFLSAIGLMLSDRDSQLVDQVSADSRELPADIQAKIEAIRHKNITEKTLQSGEVVEPGVVKLGHIYGESYSGGGCAYGKVTAYDLSEWLDDKWVEKEIVTKCDDNGFIIGINEIMIEPNTIVLCQGGDSTIGRDGRYWNETYVCKDNNEI